jgi:Pyruvate/2-oxoacid:ferredoxin oxidoreductase gamma subunit
MVMLGAFIKYSNLARIENLMEVLPSLVRGKEILELDKKAIAEGFNLV